MPQTDTLPSDRYALKASTIKFTVKEFMRYDSLKMEYAYKNQIIDTALSVIGKQATAIKGYQDNEKKLEMTIGILEAGKAAKDFTIAEGLKREKKLVIGRRIRNIVIAVVSAVAIYFAYQASKK